MCQGVRDVANLAWKLDYVLRGQVGDALLDTYGAERGAHVRRITTTIEGIGRNICERDLTKARQRDADLIAQAGGSIKSVPRRDLIPPLECGLPAPQAQAANGSLFPQPRVLRDGRAGLLDDIAGGGLRVIVGQGVAPETPLASSAVTAAGAMMILVGAAGSLPAAPRTSKRSIGSSMHSINRWRQDCDAWRPCFPVAWREATAPDDMVQVQRMAVTARRAGANGLSMSRKLKHRNVNGNAVPSPREIQIQ